MSDDRINLLGYGLPSLREHLQGKVDAPYRIEQIYRALYHEHTHSFQDMTTLPRSLREELDRAFSLRTPEVKLRTDSEDGTTKFLFDLADERTIEAVDIPDTGHRTYCVSSQAGCALACRFCVTGYWGAGRDLTAAEIVGQVLEMRSQNPVPFSEINLVLMGMGEPLLNLEAVHEALEVLAIHIGWRQMTLSTAGVIPGIERMKEWPNRPNLALSLHAPDDDRRSRLMPINRKYPLEDLLGCLADYPTTRRSALTFEYTLIRGFNDAPEDAAAVADLINHLRAKVNLIPLNPDPVLGPEMRAPLWDDVVRFQSELLARNIRCSIRRPKGDDIAAACGQLRALDRPARGFRSPPVIQSSPGP